jgi:hypothetical protein
MLGFIRLSKDERELLIGMMHMVQDVWAETETDLATATDPRDKEFLADISAKQEAADVLRKRLGDKWKPASEFTDDELRKMIEQETL